MDDIQKAIADYKGKFPKKDMSDVTGIYKGVSNVNYGGQQFLNKQGVDLNKSSS